MTTIKRTTCRITGEPLVPLFSLGDIYISDFLNGNEIPDPQNKVELKLAMSKYAGIVQLTNTADFDSMYTNYWYKSGINESMVKELKGIVDSVLSVKKLQDEDVWIDIGCNDGTLLKFVPENIFRVGVDPVKSNCDEANAKGISTINDYFSFEAVGNDPKASVITSIAMFYDLEDPKKFCNDIYEVLEDNGLWVIQLSYLPLMIEQLAFDNICHEHLEYYSLDTIMYLLGISGFKVVDVQLNDTNGGSIRVYAQKTIADVDSFASAPYRDVARIRITSLMNYEHSHGYDAPNALLYESFFHKIEKLKTETVDFIKNAKAEGKTVWGYGASTKGNTLLQYFGLDNSLIDGIAERSESKFGLRTVGTNIPITDEATMRKANPDYLLVLPWHFINGFVERERQYLLDGGKFIVPCPKFQVISKDDL